MSRASRFARYVAPVVAILASSGCVFYVGTPAQSPHGLQDLRYGKAPRDLLRPGTTREDVLTRLGTPDRVVDGGRTILYVAPVESGQLWVVTSGSGSGVQPLGSSVALAVTFDDAGRYASHRIEVAGLGEPHVAAQRALPPAKSPASSPR